MAHIRAVHEHPALPKQRSQQRTHQFLRADCLPLRIAVAHASQDAAAQYIGGVKVLDPRVAAELEFEERRRKFLGLDAAGPGGEGRAAAKGVQGGREAEEMEAVWGLEGEGCEAGAEGG